MDKHLLPLSMVAELPIVFDVAFIYSALIVMLCLIALNHTLSFTSHINCIIARWPDKRCLSHGMCLYQAMVTLHVLNDVVHDV